MKKIIIFNLFFVFILIVLFEIILRTIFNINVQGISKNLLNKNLNYTFNQPNLKNGLAFGAKVYTDENGLRTLEVKNYKKDAKDVFFIGGSVTFGPAVKAEKTFVEKLNNESDLNVLNASAFGSQIKNHYMILKNLDLSKTDKVFISFSLDDISDRSVFNEDKEIKEKNFIYNLRSIKFLNKIFLYLRSNSATYVLAKNIILNSREGYYIHDLNLYNNKLLVENIDKNISLISEEFKEKKDKVYFFIIPYAMQITPQNCKSNDNAEQIIFEKLKKYEFNIISLKNSFCNYGKKNNLFLKFDPAHLSATGHDLVYKELKNYLN